MNWLKIAIRNFQRRRHAFIVAIPLLWLLVFFLAPFLVLFQISFSEAIISSPPYSPLIETARDTVNIRLNWGNYSYLWEDDIYLNAYLSSIRIALVSTLVTLLIGYPMAYRIARAPDSLRNILLLLVILPFWTSFLLRVYAWIGFLRPNGVVNNALIGLGIIDTPLVLLQTDFAVHLGIIYTYLPFMILPIYANVVKLNEDLLEVSSDLGAQPLTTFFTVTLPLSAPGIIAGCLLVFIPAIGEFVIPELLGSSETQMIGRVLWNEFFANRDWPVASAVAIVMLILIVAPLMWLRGHQQEKE